MQERKDETGRDEEKIAGPSERHGREPCIANDKRTKNRPKETLRRSLDPQKDVEEIHGPSKRHQEDPWILKTNKQTEKEKKKRTWRRSLDL